jgi:transposase
VSEISGDPRAKESRRAQHSFDHAICALRSRIERFINRLKDRRRVATRCDRTASSFVSLAMLASIRQRINFGLATWLRLASRSSSRLRR